MFAKLNIRFLTKMLNPPGREEECAGVIQQTYWKEDLSSGGEHHGVGTAARQDDRGLEGRGGQL